MSKYYTIKTICNDCISEFIKNNVYEQFPSDKADMMLNFLEDYQDLIWAKDNEMELSFNDIDFDFEETYKFNTNIFRLNYAGTEAYFYFISIPDNELQTYFYKLDEYPIYVYYADIDEVERRYNNFYYLMDAHMDNKELLLKFSKNSIHQEMPIKN